MIDVEYAVRTHDVGKVVTVMCTFLEKLPTHPPTNFLFMLISFFYSFLAPILSVQGPHSPGDSA